MLEYCIIKPVQSGVYKIRNLTNDRFYIGSTVCFWTRWRSHRNALKGNYHANCFLLADYQKDKKAIFVFELIEEVSINDLLKAEQKYLNQHFNNVNCYNLCQVAGNTLGRKFSSETKAKMSTHRKGKNCGTKNGMFGKRHTRETRAKMIQNHRNYNGENHPHYGKKHKTKQVEAINIESGKKVQFDNAREASLILSLDSGGISRNLNGKAKIVKGWRFSYV